MLRKAFLVFFLLVSTPVLAQSAFVLDCPDGDTCHVKIGKKKERVRLSGIDAPEVSHGKQKGQPFGREAQIYLNKLVQGGYVTLKTHGRDDYGRLLADMTDDRARDVGQLLLQEGYAEVYHGLDLTPKNEKLFSLEKQARQAKKGMWSQKKYESPYDFRKRNRK